jgi:hypothetical protein
MKGTTKGSLVQLNIPETQKQRGGEEVTQDKNMMMMMIVS